MLTEVASFPAGETPASSPASSVAAAMADAEEARRSRCDATAIVERMAARARVADLDHPVAAALALAARMGRLCGPEAFAASVGLPVEQVLAAEGGAVPFGSLPGAYGVVFAAMAVDLLSLADLARTWD